MPLQNRVTPFGDIVAIPERGLMFGNRGRLHNDHRQIVRYSQVQRWLVCVLAFRGRHREIMHPGYYTELFFLDEATALAAGHRPCAECRRPDYQRFRRCWNAARGDGSGALPSAGAMDAQLHQERMETPGVKRTHQAEIATLADSVFIAREGEAWLLWQSAMLRWTPRGYDQRQQRPARGIVTVLTPRSTAGVIAAGYVPTVHPSAQ